jgi:hypothetical protein
VIEVFGNAEASAAFPDQQLKTAFAFGFFAHAHPQRCRADRRITTSFEPVLESLRFGIRVEGVCHVLPSRNHANAGQNGFLVSS